MVESSFESTKKKPSPKTPWTLDLWNKWLEAHLEASNMNWIEPIELFHSTLTNWNGYKLNWKHKKKNPQELHELWTFKISGQKLN